MNFYTVRKGSNYLDRDGCGSFQPVPMDDRSEAERVASQGGGVVEVWVARSEGTYPVPGPALPRLELAG